MNRSDITLFYLNHVVEECIDDYNKSLSHIFFHDASISFMLSPYYFVYLTLLNEWNVEYNVMSKNKTNPSWTRIEIASQISKKDAIMKCVEHWIDIR